LTVSRTSFGALKSNGQFDIGLEGLVKKFLIAAVAALALATVATTASAQRGGGGGGMSHSGGGGGWHGGSGGGWHGGSSGWHGGHDGHSHFGVVVGFPYYWPYYGYYPYGYYPYAYGYGTRTPRTMAAIPPITMVRRKPTPARHRRSLA
jgi:hypothetical protein